MEREPQTARERAVLLLRATLLPGWHPTASQGLVWAIRGTVVLGVLVLLASAVDKTLWDWLQLLIVPAVLAFGGYLFNSSQNRATQAAAERRAQDEALQAYLDHIGELMLNTGKPLRKSNEGDEARTLARARTLTVLRRLDAERKGRVLQFLYESGLITRDHVVVDVSRADLFEADLLGANLVGADLSEVQLQRADLLAAKLTKANLVGAILAEANLYQAFLEEANLSGAALIGANMSRAFLIGADLNKANLSGANLSGANLSRATGITIEELEQESLSLKGATMPNGQKYEEWLKSKDSGEE